MMWFLYICEGLENKSMRNHQIADIFKATVKILIFLNV